MNLKLISQKSRTQTTFILEYVSGELVEDITVGAIYRMDESDPSSETPAIITIHPGETRAIVGASVPTTIRRAEVISAPNTDVTIEIINN